ncbi:MAG: asparagine synthase (glutamine-hydrolyzing) [Gammaproteobacteria bacterium]|nr:asparagine synthase (glutamine-hydrolyzing) [Gammaproteobacteria bacterium]
MCGIAGFIDTRGKTSTVPLSETVRQMAAELTHRGPDDSGEWYDDEQRIALGHRRLAILDLSSAGHQPMTSASGRFVIAYNGEVYNFAELRAELADVGLTFRGHSDTEVILEAISTWGLEKTLPRLIGMFAIALWDKERCELSLVRDRLGIKPLYWGYLDGSLIFASELKAFRPYPGWHPTLNRDAIAAYLRHNYIPTPHCIYQGVHKLQPGCYLTFAVGREPEIHHYWDFRDIAARAVADRRPIEAEEAEQTLDELLRDAVSKRMVADVPLGALLSGGVDSSLVTALMQAQSNRPIKSFSIGFAEAEYDEAPYARKIAAHLGTDHTELYVEPGHALDIIPKIPQWYDEPFADSSQIPTYLVCELTRKHVTVALSGDGGDELFAGYNRYTLGAQIWHRTQFFPEFLRKAVGTNLRRIQESSFDKLAKLLPSSRRPTLFGHKVHKLADGLLRPDSDAMYRQLVTHWRDPNGIVIGASEPQGHLWNPDYQKTIPEFTERMQFLDTLTYLPDDILTKVDRASMAVSLEARVPLIDHRVVEFAWQLPLHLKIHRGRSKILLRRVLDRYVPREMTDRPKMGFGVPIDLWLRDSLRDWAESLLDERRLREQGLLDPAPIREKWRAHLAGENWAYPLWDVLMLQAWLDHYHP